MNAEIVAIGSELTTGAKLDTNSQWLSQELAAIGIPVSFHTTVADDQDEVVSAFRIAAERTEVVLITGGLGPTLDDLTRQCLADLMGVPLVEDEASLQRIRDMFSRRGREMPERNAIQAMFPEGSRVIPNPRGTAPGILVEWPHPRRERPTILAAMPGVPSEMKRMYHQEVRPLLPGGGRVIRRYRINCFGTGESHAEELLGDLTARGRDPEVGITVHEATITLRITASAATEEECLARFESTRTVVHERLGNYVFGEEDEELEHIVLRLLAAEQKTLATAEAGTGGLLAHRLTDVPGFESNYFGGIVASTATARERLLDVPEALSETAVSAEVAKAMATGCRNRLGSDYGLAITECPQSDPDDTDADVPMAWVALSGPEFVRAVSIRLGGDPAILKSRTAKAALNLLRLELLKQPQPGQR